MPNGYTNIGHLQETFQNSLVNPFCLLSIVGTKIGHLQETFQNSLVNLFVC